MTNKTKNQRLPPFCGQDLEHWRGTQHLSKSAAADAFGLQRAAWDKLTSGENLKTPLADPVLAMLLAFYIEHPDCAPRREEPAVKDFYNFLELGDSGEDRAKFAVLVGRSKPSVCRLLLEGGKPGRPVLKWIEAIRTTRLPPAQARRLMEDIAASVAERQKTVP